MIYCFSTCRDSIRTIPVLQHDPNRAEDLDTNSEDHAADDWRYAAMSRPWLRSQDEKKQRKHAYQLAEEEIPDDFSYPGKRCEHALHRSPGKWLNALTSVLADTCSRSRRRRGRREQVASLDHVRISLPAG
jgi:hypothetical protein